jgi:hypothetical protein
MGTLGNIPPQYKIPGNLKSIPKELTSNLDPSKLKQLSPAQLDAIKNLPPEKLASLNNIPIDQIKNLDPNSLKDYTSRLPNSNQVKNKQDKLKKQIKDRFQKEEEKKQRIEQALSDPKSFLKEQKQFNTKDTKNQIVSIITPILTSFIRAENIADVLIKKLEKDTRKQLQNKGTLTIVGGQFTFTPSDIGNYSTFKTNFDKRVYSIKKSIDTLNKIINTLTNTIKILNLALSGIKLFVKIKTKLRTVQLAKISVELAAPTPGGAKPTAGPSLISIITSLDNLNTANKKIETYQAAITATQSFLNVFREMITKIKTRVDQLRFEIINDSSSSNSTNDISNQLIIENIPTDENYISVNGKSYILKPILLPNGQRQYQALDSFSKLKITQTAPSRVKTDAQLLEEIKQILG